MRREFWEQVREEGFPHPAGSDLAELTVELTELLGCPDPGLRHEMAAACLRTWVDQGVYDALLLGLGDGMTAGLRVGLGSAVEPSVEGTAPTVLRRSHSAHVLEACLARASLVDAVEHDHLLRWGDRLMSWIVREQDLRITIPGMGLADPLGYAAKALATLASSKELGEAGLVAVLDVIAERSTVPCTRPWLAREADGFARVAGVVVGRGEVTPELLRSWLERLTLPPGTTERDNSTAVLRAFNLWLQLTPQAVPHRERLEPWVQAAVIATAGDLLR